MTSFRIGNDSPVSIDSFTLISYPFTKRKSAGIRFPATQVSSSNINTLDDYEEGTFTPTVYGGTTAGAGTYLTQEARYTKIGRLVHCSVYMDWSAHTGTGQMLLGGFPFTFGHISSAAFGLVSAITLAANSWMQAYANTGSTYMYLGNSAVGGGAWASISIDTSGSISFDVVYTV